MLLAGSIIVNKPAFLKGWFDRSRSNPKIHNSIQQLLLNVKSNAQLATTKLATTSWQRPVGNDTVSSDLVGHAALEMMDKSDRVYSSVG